MTSQVRPSQPLGNREGMVETLVKTVDDGAPMVCPSGPGVSCDQAQASDPRSPVAVQPGPSITTHVVDDPSPQESAKPKPDAVSAISAEVEMTVVPSDDVLG